MALKRFVPPGTAGVGTPGDPGFQLGDTVFDPTAAIFQGGTGTFAGNAAALGDLGSFLGNQDFFDPFRAFLMEKFPNQKFGETAEDLFSGSPNNTRNQLMGLQQFAQAQNVQNFSAMDFAKGGLGDPDLAAFDSVFNTGNVQDINTFLGQQGFGNQVGVDEFGKVNFQSDFGLNSDVLSQYFGEGGEFQAFQAEQNGLVPNPNYDPSGGSAPAPGDRDGPFDPNANTTDPFIPDPTLIDPGDGQAFLDAIDLDPLTDGVQTLDELYGGDDSLAMADWGRFLDSLVNPDDPAQGTYRDMFTARGAVLPTFDQQGVLVEGDVDRENAEAAIRAFGQWKVDKDAGVAETAAKGEAAETFGIDAEGLVLDDEGNYVPDPEKYIQNEDGEYVLKDADPGTDLGAGEQGDFDRLMTELFGSSGDDLIDRLNAGYKTDEEILAAFENIFAPVEERFDRIGLPEAKAGATERAGGFLGSAQSDAAAEATSAHAAARLAAFQTYNDSATAHNLDIWSKTLDTVNTVGEYTKTLAGVGRDIAASNLMIQQAQSMAANDFLQLALGEAQFDLLTKNIEGAELDNMSKIFQLAAAEAQIDVNAMLQAQQWYLNNYVGAFGDPMMATYLALMDMSLITNVQTPNSAAALTGSLIGAVGTAAGGYLSRPATPAPGTGLNPGTL